MAYWQRRKGKIYVYQYNKELGRPVAIPRPDIEQLDTKGDAEIERWVRQWESDNGVVQQNRGKRGATVTWTPKLARLFAEYQQERAREEGVGPRSLQNERTYFEKYVFRYFVEVHKRNDPSRWKDVGTGFRTWLTENTKLEVKTKKQIILAVNRFGAFLKEIGAIKTEWKLKAPKLGQKRLARKTPLPREVPPDEVLTAVRTIRHTHPEWALALLVGYFACLRPEETFALTRDDFLSGEDAVKESQTRERISKYSIQLKQPGKKKPAKVQLGSKLVVSVTKALESGFIVGPPKNHNSNGSVLIWLPDAALLLRDILVTRESGVPFFVNGKSTLFKKYKKQAFHLLGVTLHDLRRASALYLGRTVCVDPLLLQEMLRHSDLEMVTLYTRRPDVEAKTAGQLDLNDVV